MAATNNERSHSSVMRIRVSVVWLQYEVASTVECNLHVALLLVVGLCSPCWLCLYYNRLLETVKYYLKYFKKFFLIVSRVHSMGGTVDAISGHASS